MIQVVRKAMQNIDSRETSNLYKFIMGMLVGLVFSVLLSVPDFAYKFVKLSIESSGSEVPYAFTISTITTFLPWVGLVLIGIFAFLKKRIPYGIGLMVPAIFFVLMFLSVYIMAN
jgi:hypothetical protein